MEKKKLENLKKHNEEWLIIKIYNIYINIFYNYYLKLNLSKIT